MLAFAHKSALFALAMLLASAAVSAQEETTANILGRHVGATLQAVGAVGSMPRCARPNPVRLIPINWLVADPRRMYLGILEEDQLPGFVHIDIAADDPQRAASFYRDVFGWTITKLDGPTPYWLATPEGAGPGAGIDRRFKHQETFRTFAGAEA